MWAASGGGSVPGRFGAGSPQVGRVFHVSVEAARRTSAPDEVRCWSPPAVVVDIAPRSGLAYMNLPFPCIIMGLSQVRVLSHC